METVNIQVLGMGCPTCKKLLDVTRRAVAELGLDATVEYVTDVRKIREMGLMRTPVLAVNGKPVAVGYIPNLEDIKGFIGKNTT